MNNDHNNTKRALPAGVPTGLTPPRKAVSNNSFKDKSMNDKKVEEDTEDGLVTPPATTNVSKTTPVSVSTRVTRQSVQQKLQAQTFTNDVDNEQDNEGINKQEKHTNKTNTTEEKATTEPGEVPTASEQGDTVPTTKKGTLEEAYQSTKDANKQKNTDKNNKKSNKKKNTKNKGKKQHEMTMKKNTEDMTNEMNTGDEAVGKKPKTTTKGNEREMDDATKVAIAATKANIMAKAEALIVRETRRVIEANEKNLKIDDDDEDMDSSNVDPQPEVVVIVDEDSQEEPPVTPENIHNNKDDNDDEEHQTEQDETGLKDGKDEKSQDDDGKDDEQDDMDDKDNGEDGGESEEDESVSIRETAEECSYRLLRERNQAIQAIATETEETDERAEEDSFESIRLFVCIDIQEYEGQDDYHERFADGFNSLMTAITQVEPGVKFLPWESLICNMARSRATLPATPNGYRKFVYFKNKWISKGRKWTRIHIAFPTKGDVQVVLEEIEENSDWWEENRFYAHVSPCQGRVPFVIGFLSRSIEVMTISDEFQYVLRIILEEPSLGLLWKKIEKDPKARKSLGGTTHGQVTSKKKKGEKAAREKMVWAVHIEVDMSAADRTTRRLVTLYNQGQGDYPLSYSVYFVHELEHRVMKTFQGRQGYLKAWTHQQSLMESLFQEHCNIVNIDNPVPNTILGEDITFRQFLSKLTVTATEGVNGDKLFVAIGRASLEGMTFCFTYHSLAITEAEEVTRNLPLVYEHEFNGNPSDFFEYDLRQQLDGYRWNTQRRQASSPESAAIFLYGSSMVADREDPEMNIDTINPLQLVTYKRLQGQCDETVMNGVDNSRARAAEVRNQTDQPQNVTNTNDNSSTMSELTTGTGRRSSSTRHTTRTDGSVGTSKSRVAQAVDKVNSQWDNKLEEEKSKAEREIQRISEESDKKLLLLVDQLKQAGLDVPAHLLSSLPTKDPQSPMKPPVPILNNSSTKSGQQTRPSGHSANWNPNLPTHNRSEDLASNQGQSTTKSTASPLSEPAVKQPPVLLPPLPGAAAFVYTDEEEEDFTVYPCSYCLRSLTSKRCSTQIPEKDDHFYFEDAPRCGRAFCDSCTHHYLQTNGIDLTYPSNDIVCPFHLLQSWISPDIASQGIVYKSHEESSPPLRTDDSEEPGPSSDGAEAP